MKKILVLILVSMLAGSACAETGSEDAGFWISPITDEIFCADSGEIL